MTFRLTCPVCGKRDIQEFTFGGQERGPRPEQERLSAEEHFRWVQFRMIPGGAEAVEKLGSRAGRQAVEDAGPLAVGQAALQQEWWYHGQGCGVWFRTTRDPGRNREVGGEDGEE